MQRDAKFGLIMGVVLVLVIAVVFSRQTPEMAASQPIVPTVSTTKIAGAPIAAQPVASNRDAQ